MKYYIKKLIVIFSIFSLIGCFSEKKLINKLEHNAKIVYDTITIKDTFYTKHIKFDTSFTFFKNTIDSITLNVNNTKNPILLNLKKIYDTIKVNLNIPSDTLIKTKDITYQKFIIESQNKFENAFKNFVYLHLIILLITLILLAYTILKSK